MAVGRSAPFPFSRVQISPSNRIESSSNGFRPRSVSSSSVCVRWKRPRQQRNRAKARAPGHGGRAGGRSNAVDLGPYPGQSFDSHLLSTEIEPSIHKPPRTGGLGRPADHPSISSAAAAPAAVGRPERDVTSCVWRQAGTSVGSRRSVRRAKVGHKSCAPPAPNGRA